MSAAITCKFGIFTIPRVAAVLILVGPLLSAHPDPGHSLQSIAEHLAATPNDPLLFLNRADVYLGIGDIARAQTAINRAETLNPKTPGLGYYKARVFLGLRQSDRSDDARLCLEKLLIAEPLHADAWRLLAKILLDAGCADAAINAASHVLLTDPRQLSPGDYTRTASLQLRRNQPGDAEQALAILNQGLARFGCLKGLHYMGCDIELRLGRHDAALQRLAALSARFRPQVEFEVKRAEILVTAKRFREAAQAYDNALAILDSYPAERRASGIYKQTRANYLILRDQTKNSVSGEVPH